MLLYFFLEKKGKLKIRVHDKTHKSFEESRSWCWGSSTEGLANNRELGFVPRYKNDLGKHVSLDILPVSSRKIYPKPSLSKQNK